MAKEFMDHFFGKTQLNLDDIQRHKASNPPSLADIPMKISAKWPDASIIKEERQEFEVIPTPQIKQIEHSLNFLIGSTYLMGGAVGGLTGLYKGIRKINKNNYTSKIKTTIILNHVLKEGFVQSNTMGVIGLIYSGVYLLIENIRPDCDDVLINLISGTATGLLYKSTAGIKKCVQGGVFGMCTSVIYSVYKNFKKTESIEQEGT
ncbi:mitochondrial import inner membrane translocase subunit Tim23-like [Teleopsis dalmanni]|uniref:mitochondrial import inner membrane translocase subunit Tim23-like n=1 Tax=Teleopsis dalmanni TaxID=139649 RepID=UPI0018CD1736|nr:mitochondrial import inner membrane translocase subunit Tim23-like [Teleopsis dalmanni]